MTRLITLDPADVPSDDALADLQVALAKYHAAATAMREAWAAYNEADRVATEARDKSGTAMKVYGEAKDALEALVCAIGDNYAEQANLPGALAIRRLYRRASAQPLVKANEQA
jgi:hypothetical protein